VSRLLAPACRRRLPSVLPYSAAGTERHGERNVRAARVGAVSEPESAELLSVGCECAANCGEDVLVTAAEYADAHREADYVLVRPGHPVKAGSRGSRVVGETDRYSVIAEGWALTDDEVSPRNRARLAELKAQSFLRSAANARVRSGLPRGSGSGANHARRVGSPERETIGQDWTRYGRQQRVRAERAFRSRRRPAISCWAGGCTAPKPNTATAAAARRVRRRVSGTRR